MKGQGQENKKRDKQDGEKVGNENTRTHQDAIIPSFMVLDNGPCGVKGCKRKRTSRLILWVI
jgi:hypothetical protein